MTNYQKSKHIIQALVRGNDPLTGWELPKDSVLDNIEVLRALLDAVAALEQVSARQARRAMLPSEVGKTWTMMRNQLSRRSTRAESRFQI
jgi:hypothetical protein